jgi:hypothetical protein
VSVSASQASKKQGTKEEKSHKAEADKMKKAEKKAKRLRLAEELKERERRKGLMQDKQSIHSNRSGGRGGRRNWDPDASLYGGLGAAF